MIQTPAQLAIQIISFQMIVVFGEKLPKVHGLSHMHQRATMIDDEIDHLPYPARGIGMTKHEIEHRAIVPIGFSVPEEKMGDQQKRRLLLTLQHNQLGQTFCASPSSPAHKAAGRLQEEKRRATRGQGSAKRSTLREAAG
jgi:hypothetical protein